jgi:uncharacterized protein (DUF2141 family)
MFGSCFLEIGFSINLEGMTGRPTFSPQAFNVPGKLTATVEWVFDLALV